MKEEERFIELAEEYRETFGDVVPLMELQGVSMANITKLVEKALKDGVQIETSDNQDILY